MKKVMIDPKTKRVRVQTINTMPSETQQHHAESVDINQIMKKYRHINNVPNFQSTGLYADVSGFRDYQTSLQKVLDAQSAFGTLPSDLRTRFDNDPNKLIAFMSDPKNYDEGVSLGLYAPKNQTDQNAAQNKRESNANEIAANKTSNKTGASQEPKSPKGATE